MKLESWKEDFEGRLNSPWISSLEVLNEEECDATKHADICEDENFSSDEVWRVAKVFLGKKESSEEEKDESIFSGYF